MLSGREKRSGIRNPLKMVRNSEVYTNSQPPLVTFGQVEYSLMSLMSEPAIHTRYAGGQLVLCGHWLQCMAWGLSIPEP